MKALLAFFWLNFVFGVENLNILIAIFFAQFVSLLITHRCLFSTLLLDVNYEIFKQEWDLHMVYADHYALSQLDIQDVEVSKGSGSRAFMSLWSRPATSQCLSSECYSLWKEDTVCISNLTSALCKITWRHNPMAVVLSPRLIMRVIKIL